MPDRRHVYRCADRVGIMSQGRLLCVGQAEDLKARFGGGYKLSATCCPADQEEMDKFVRVRLSLSRLTVHAYISSFIAHEFPTQSLPSVSLDSQPIQFVFLGLSFLFTESHRKRCACTIPRCLRRVFDSHMCLTLWKSTRSELRPPHQHVHTIDSCLFSDIV